MQVNPFIVTVAVAGLLFSCREKNVTLTAEDRNEISKEVKQMLLSYASDVKKNGLTAEFNYLDHSPDFFWVPPDYGSAISYDSVASVLEANADYFKSIENSYDSLTVIPLKRDLATYTAILTSSMVDTAGSKSTVRLIETGVVVKRDSGWKLLSGQTSLINPKHY
jgi:hypothetical protein